MQTQPLLSVQQLRVTAGSAVLVDDISFTLNKGEVLGLGCREIHHWPGNPRPLSPGHEHQRRRNPLRRSEAERAL